MAPPRHERQRTPAGDKPNYPAALLAGILAWVIPGAGHMYLGRALRGIILCICINGLFWAGVAFGGVFTVEPLRERWWFAAQVGAGASKTKIESISPPPKGDRAEILEGSTAEVVSGLLGKIKELGLL